MARRRRANPISDCPLTAATAVMGGKWKLIIIYWLAESSRHFGQLRRLLPSISQKVLTEQLRELMADGIVRRESTGRAPAPVRYSLTEYGRSLVPIVEAVRCWGRGHIERFGSAGESGLKAQLEAPSSRNSATPTGGCRPPEAWRAASSPSTIRRRNG